MQTAQSLESPSSQSQQQRQGSGQQSWRGPADYAHRQALVQHIFRLFSQRKPNVTQEWQEKLPDFVRRLEEALYKAADSLEEYINPQTLEARLQNVARKMVNRSPSQPGMPRSGAGQSLPNALMSGPGQGGLNFSDYNLQTSTSSQMLPAGGNTMNGLQGGMVPNGTAGGPGTSGPMLSPNNAGFVANSTLTTSSGVLGMGSRLGSGNGNQLGGVLGNLQQAPQVPVKSENGGMGLNGTQNQPMLRGLGNASSGQVPVMSNGAPVLMRTQRDWPQGQSPMIRSGASQNNHQRILINGLPPGQLAAGNQGGVAPGPAGQPQTLQNSMRLGSGNLMNMNAAIMPNHAQQQPGMVPAGMQPGGQLNGSGGLLPVNNHMMGGMNGNVGSPSLGPPLGQIQNQPSLNGSSAQFMPINNFNGDGSGAGTGTDELHMKMQQKRDYIAKQQRWLLFLRHCAKCGAPDGQCQYGNSCQVAKALWKHILNCGDPTCEYPRCVTSRELLKHHQKCTAPNCPVCTPVKQYVQKQRLAAQRRSGAGDDPAQRRGLPPGADPRLAMHGGAQPNGHNMMVPGGMGFMPDPRGSAIGMAGPPVGMTRGADAAVGPAAVKRQRVTMQENAGTSLLECFSAEQIDTHLKMLRDEMANRPGGVNQYAALDDDNTCKACYATRLTFEPAAIYCSSCAQKIKRNLMYYATPLRSEVKGTWCTQCMGDHKPDLIDLDGTQIRKADLEKRKNDEETEEGWVCCDHCERWVHQVCGMFNKGRNDDNMPYMCPMCLLEGLQQGKRTPTKVRPQAMLEARDLPTCELSEHLELRMREALQRELVARAKQHGTSIDQEIQVTGLTVRVINNVKKVMEVKPRFLEAFKQDGCSEGYPYKQKVILLFQNIDGVDVCLYCLYTQEYGDECSPPNRKWVYLSYLDSVKYFRPEDLQAAGFPHALRTLVYHEILVAYLEDIKRRGFCTMFIWACPPLQGDDYILYCHPNRQKTPRSDRLREWYHTLLRIAKERGIVTHLSNLFDTFFEGGKDHRHDKPSILHLPYFEGDYWPGEADNILSNIKEEARREGKKGKKAGGGLGARSKGAKGKRYGAGPQSTDRDLMDRLGAVIQGMKDDFIVVHLYQPCSMCRTYISGAPRHYHPAPPAKTVVKELRTFEGISLDNPGQPGSKVQQLGRFQICDACYRRESGALDCAAEGNVRPRGLPAGIDLRELRTDHLPLIPATSDPNPDYDCEFFHTRQNFLSLCQGNHYQFDTIRRAKHSSMMVLYHLHNPDAPAFVCTCNACGKEIEPGMGLRCTVCSDFDICIHCHNDPAMRHQHPMQPHVRKSDETRARMTEEERQERAKQLQRTMSLLVHASGCTNAQCPSSNCTKVKALFQHAVQCQRKVTGGCQLCRRMWALLQLHAKQCSANDCPVPRCRELREMRRRQMARAEEKRRHAYTEMLRRQNEANAQAAAAAMQHRQLPAPQHAY